MNTQAAQDNLVTPPLTQEAPVIELKAINLQISMSEETYCFRANLYVDGKKIGGIGNTGQGGSHDFHGDHAEFERVDNWLKANHPPVECYGTELTMDLEFYVSRLVEEFDKRRAFRNTLKKITLVKPDGVYTLKAKPTPSNIERVKELYPDAKHILNELPFDEAFDLYQKSVGEE